ncbi:hypothetical protein LZ554_006704 [Drepanopeziza brunnea f. sp. 'monogermtubi']|nr:hypothetical protein LZ554_006704 [Drepanopeziza brunnea f. sp. 'monogermtubi']
MNKIDDLRGTSEENHITTSPHTWTTSTDSSETEVYDTVLKEGTGPMARPTASSTTFCEERVLEWRYHLVRKPKQPKEILYQKVEIPEDDAYSEQRDGNSRRRAWRIQTTLNGIKQNIDMYHVDICQQEGDKRRTREREKILK